VSFSFYIFCFYPLCKHVIFLSTGKKSSLEIESLNTGPFSMGRKIIEIEINGEFK